MVDQEWHNIVELVTPHVIRIWTPQGSGTGFLVSISKSTSLCAVATAAHVIAHAHYWEEPLRRGFPQSESGHRDDHQQVGGCEEGSQGGE
jgi:hypothetical protein